MENPQIEIGEVPNPMLDVNFVCDRIISTLERFGSKRFKSTGYKTLQEIINAGALGAEIIISGKVPSARARSWRFSAGYLKKSGDVSENYVNRTCGTAQLKPGIIGVKVSIMLDTIPMPDKMSIRQEAKTDQKEPITQEKTEQKEIEAPKENLEKSEEPTLKKEEKAKKKEEKNGNNK